MLVLSRTLSESIVVTMPDGRTIICKVNEIRGDKVRLAWEAPVDVVIHRQEVHDAIAAEKRAADTAANPGLGEDFG